jgi:hypothetical protein
MALNKRPENQDNRNMATRKGIAIRANNNFERSAFFRKGPISFKIYGDITYFFHDLDAVKIAFDEYFDKRGKPMTNKEAELLSKTHE